MSSERMENSSVQEINELHTILSGPLIALTASHLVIQFSAIPVLSLLSNLDPCLHLYLIFIHA